MHYRLWQGTPFQMSPRKQSTKQTIIIKPTRCTDFLKFYFEMKLYMFLKVPLSIIRSYILYIQQWCISYRSVDSFRAGSWSCPKAVYKPVWRIPLLCVRWETPDDGQRNCPKHVEFHFRIKFEKISASSWVLLWEFITIHGHMNVKFTNKPSFIAYTPRKIWRYVLKYTTSS
jgi:hypothetical protein